MSLFKERLKALGFDSYKEYLESPLWKSFKERFNKSNRHKICAVCGSKRIQLHHHTYVRIGREELSDVTPLCREHHEAVHEWLENRDGKKYVEHTYQAIKFLRGEKVEKKEYNREKWKSKKKKKESKNRNKVTQTPPPIKKKWKNMTTEERIKENKRIVEHLNWRLEEKRKKKKQRLAYSTAPSKGNQRSPYRPEEEVSSVTSQPTLVIQHIPAPRDRFRKKPPT